LDIRGTDFQRRVWTELCQIAPGTTVSYAEVAQRIGAPKALRAVAGACAANRLAIVIPCHRVLRLNGSLSGYRWGRERKLRLIEMEKNAASLIRASSSEVDAGSREENA
jgi:AraC family transcriptional regulator of adaptative response/methylated-DNA-[protein]-cysteine methyltransferase